MECNASAWLSWFCRIFISWTQWSSYFVNREIEQKSQWVFPSSSPIFWLICLMMKLELESFVWKLPKILLFRREKKKLVVPIENSLMSVVVVWSVTLYQSPNFLKERNTIILCCQCVAVILLISSPFESLFDSFFSKVVKCAIFGKTPCFVHL